MAKKTLPVDVLKSLGVTDKPTGSSIARRDVAPQEIKRAGESGEEPVRKVADEGRVNDKTPVKQALSTAVADKSKRLNIYLTEAQHQELRILSVTTGEPAYQICVDAMIKAGVISK